MTQAAGTAGISLTASRIIVLNSLLLGSFVVWASMTEIDEVTRAEGKVVPSSKIQTIQSAEAGTVKEILIREGQQVKKGQILLRIDDTLTSASLGEAKAKALTLKAQIARLNVEHSEAGIDKFKCPPEIEQTDKRICENERNLLRVRYENYNNKRSVLRERRQQRKRELAEINANIERFNKSLEIAHKELQLLTPLARRNLVAQTELLQAQRNVADYQGQLTAAKESHGRIQSALRESDVQIKEASSFFRQEALREMTEKLSELSIVAETQRGCQGARSQY